MSAFDTAPALPAWIGRSDGSPLERLPLLSDLMTQTAEIWADLFVGFCGADAEMAFLGAEAAVLEALPLRRGASSTFGVALVPSWNAEIAFNFDRTFVVTMVDVLFGGEIADGSPGEGDEPLSPVERRIAETMVRQLTEALTKGFASQRPTDFRFDRILAKPDLGFLGRRGASVLVLTLGVKVLGRTLQCDVLMPLAVLESMADAFAARADEAEGADPRWSQRLEAEVGRAMTTLHAAIPMSPMSLGTIARLAPGQVLPLPSGAGSNVRLACADDDLFRCDLGQSDGFYTLRIEDSLGVEHLGDPREAPSMATRP